MDKQEYWMNGDDQVTMDIIRVINDREVNTPKHINAYLKNMYANTILTIEWADEDNYNSLAMIVVGEGEGYIHGSLDEDVVQAGITFMCDSFGMEEEEFEVRR